MAVAAAALTFACAPGGTGKADDDDRGPASVSGTGQGNAPVFWLSLGDPEGRSGAASVLQSTDGGYLAAGWRGDSIYLLKIDGRGNKQWDRSFGGGTASTDAASCIRASSDGGYIVGGIRRSNAGASEVDEFYLLRIDADGNPRDGWPKTYPDANANNNGAAAVIESLDGTMVPDGYVFVGTSTSDQAVVFKVGLDGELVWKTLIPHDPAGGRDCANAVVQNQDGGFLVAGATQKGGTPNYVRVVRLNETGGLLAAATNTYGVGMAWSMRNTEDGGVVLGGTTSGGSPNEDGDALVIKLDKQGQQSWRSVLGGARDDFVHSLTDLGNGAAGYIAAGATASYSRDDSNEIRMYETFLARLDARGTAVWEKVKGLDPSSPESANDVQPTSDGGYILAGSSKNFFLLAKMDAQGDTVNLGPQDLTLALAHSGPTP